MAIEKGLLLHWWHYYGKIAYTLEELEQFEKIIDQYGTDKVMEVIVASYICFDGSPTVMLVSIRKGMVKEMFESLPDISKFEESELKEHDRIKNDLIFVFKKDMQE